MKVQSKNNTNVIYKSIFATDIFIKAMSALNVEKSFLSNELEHR